jgi:hypothetical protein
MPKGSWWSDAHAAALDLRLQSLDDFVDVVEIGEKGIKVCWGQLHDHLLLRLVILLNVKRKQQVGRLGIRELVARNRRL